MKYLISASAALLITACTATTTEQRSEREAEALRTAYADVEKVGEPEKCLQITSIRSTDVVSDWVIDFETTGGKTYRNLLPNRCSGLKIQDAFSYSTSLSQLCNVDIIRPLQTVGGEIQEVGACGLGQFQQIRELEG